MKGFKIVSISVLAREDFIDDIKEQLENTVGGEIGLFTFGTSCRDLTAKEEKLVVSQVPEGVIGRL